MSGFQTGFVASGYSRWPNIDAWGVVGRVAGVETDPEPCPPQRTLEEGRPGVTREQAKIDVVENQVSTVADRIRRGSRAVR